jgi:hypothetical protein
MSRPTDLPGKPIVLVISTVIAIVVVVFAVVVLVALSEPIQREQPPALIPAPEANTGFAPNVDGTVSFIVRGKEIARCTLTIEPDEEVP